MKDKILIGRLETVDFPSLDLFGIDAKIDTGAFSSSLHCHHIEKYYDSSSQQMVRFNLLDPGHKAYDERLYELPITDERSVKSSNGINQNRIFIKTTMILMGESFEIELSLSDRSEMKYPILLGRNFLRRRFLVDVSKKNLSIKNNSN